MPFQLRTHGDPLERRYATLIESRLPAYSTLWERYIGNDGKSQLIGQELLLPEIATKRSCTAHYTYTALEAAVCAHRLVDQSLIEIGSLETSAEVEQYIDALNVLIAFFAQVGRVRDAAKELAGLWGDPVLWEPLDEFYKQRSNILHEAKVPIAIIDGILAIVPPEGVEPDHTKWGKKRFWTDALAAPVELPVLLDDVWSRMSERLNNSFGRLHANHLATAFKALAAPFSTFTPSAIALTASASVNIPIVRPPTLGDQ